MKHALLLSLAISFLLHTQSLFAFHRATESDTVRVRVYYFHAKIRCQACLTIEQYSTETMYSVFHKELRAGKIRWQVINFEDSLTEHYIDQYKLENQALIIAKIRNGKEIAWKLLDKIWELLGDRKKFEAYVVKNVRRWL